ncbi:MAG: BNR repeat-containing protein [Candidatus Omnitrophica bacterium]|nr:BNR repeat-containing protein [Candidatus Omnitrophota bacterium]
MKSKILRACSAVLLLEAIVFLSCSAARTVRKIPVAEGLAAHPVNGGRCLISDAEHQYLAFYDGDHQMTVAKRRLGDDQWEFAKLPEKVGWDTHNRVILFQDRDGFLHITGNMHCAPLKYYRTSRPGDIQSFQPVHTWAGFYEERVTYPNLLVLRDGSLHMMYRHGGSGNGKRLLVHYDEKTQTWSGAGDAFISGMEHKPDCNAYPFGAIQEDAQGVLHIAWCWRETPDVETNYDVCYAKSLDGGFTWLRRDGSKYDLPIRPENAEVVDDIDQNSGLMNGGSLAVDRRGVPYIGYTRFDENGFNQMYVAAPQDGKWKIVQVSNFQKRFWFEGRGTIPQSPAIPRLSVDQDDRLHIRQGGKECVAPLDRFFSLKPDQCVYRPAAEDSVGVPNVRAVNIGPLPEGQDHYMQQEVDRPNRDRKPDNPKPPTMIYLVEVESPANGE